VHDIRRGRAGSWDGESQLWTEKYSATRSTRKTSPGQDPLRPRGHGSHRNLAIGALHIAGRTDITETTRWAALSMDRPFTVLGLT
jgi:hypothetical protein